MNRLRWWLVSGAGIPWALRIGARVSSTHPTGQRACRRPANFIVAGQQRVNEIDAVLQEEQDARIALAQLNELQKAEQLIDQAEADQPGELLSR